MSKNPAEVYGFCCEAKIAPIIGFQWVSDVQGERYMSDVEQRLKHSKRLANDERYIARQMRIAKWLGLKGKRVGHRLHKLNAVTCGNSNCVLCGNPRNFFGELTIQEKRHVIGKKNFSRISKKLLTAKNSDI